MRLSVVIVNYNVRHFLAQALRAVQVAIEGLEAEVWVVDNNSVDGSVAMVREAFPWVKLVANTDNVGFARANNQAIKQSSGDYVLLLNPDTIVQEDTFHKIVAFMDNTPDAGALGVRMYDGQGNFLPESKRALPTPAVAFYKMFGLSQLFPQSKRFGRYHLTYLDEHETNPVEVLSGAFMLLRRDLLLEVGMLDETYFMYGEDIDLSYEVTKAGYKNYYYAGTQIIHYKGESTKKGSLNYVTVFYNAMLIFVRKHFSRGRPSLLIALIQFAIYLRAGFSLARRLLQRALLPAFEGVLMAGATYGVSVGWLHIHPKAVPDYFWLALVPGYALTYVIGLAVSRAYKRPYRLRRLFGGVGGAFLVLVLLTFLFKPLNVSRAILVLSAGSAFAISVGLRGVFNWRRSGSLFVDEKLRPRVAIVGSIDETERVRHLLRDEVLYNAEIIGRVLPDRRPTQDETVGAFPALGSHEQLTEVLRFYRIDELIFCNASMSTQHIIDEMIRLRDFKLQFKIVPQGANYLVGPNVILTALGLREQLQDLRSPAQRIKKAALDVGLSVALLLSFPLLFGLYRRPGRALTGLLGVVAGQKHLVGYVSGETQELPPLKPGLLDMRVLLDDPNTATKEAKRLNRQYARNYSPALDWQIIRNGWRRLGATA